MPSLLTPIASLPGVKGEVAEKFKSLGVETIQDALFHFPIRHQDWRRLVPIAEIQPGQDITILGKIVSVRGRRAWRRRMHLTEAVVTDHSHAKLHITWFNQPFLVHWLKPDQEWFLSGKVGEKRGKLQLQQPMYERPGARPAHHNLVPVYPATAGLSQWQIRKIMKIAVADVGFIEETLPEEIRRHLDFPARSEAFEQIHFPATPEQGQAAVRRLKFDELLTWQLRWQRQQAGEQHPAPAIPFHEAEIRNFVQHLPFNLTKDQRLAAWEIIQDMTKSTPMSRLLQGDVGSGKTVVAAIAAYHAVRSGFQVAFLAPTLVLAEQHYKTFQKVFSDSKIQCGLITGNTPTDARRELQQGLAENRIQIVVGTHALFQSPPDWHQLGFVIVDEQQRFGVEQRQALLQFHLDATQSMPHFLSLTATPIPRTLALFFAGELAISSLRTKPPGRIPITSRVVGPEQRRQLDQAIQSAIQRGEQIFVITPLIEESDALGVRAATTEFDRLRDAYPKLRIGLLHGSLDPSRRLSILDQFRRHQLDLLVSTTVIEVGVDIPNATLMIIEGAERFGMAQLHQLRGRVGRSHKPSACYFVTDQLTPAVRQRLQRVAETDDGLTLAELDLELRGAGDLYGLRQSGLPDWKLASLEDRELMNLAREVAAHIKTKYPDWLTRSVWEATLAERPSFHRE